MAGTSEREPLRIAGTTAGGDKLPRLDWAPEGGTSRVRGGQFGELDCSTLIAGEYVVTPFLITSVVTFPRPVLKCTHVSVFGEKLTKTE